MKKVIHSSQLPTRDRNAAVRAALQDAKAKGKLGVVAAMHGLPEGNLRRYADGEADALSEFDLQWLAVDLRVT